MLQRRIDLSKGRGTLGLYKYGRGKTPPHKIWLKLWTDKNFYILSVQLNSCPPTALLFARVFALERRRALLPLAQTLWMRIIIPSARAFFSASANKAGFHWRHRADFFYFSFCIIRRSQSWSLLQPIIKLAWPSTDNESRRRDGVRSAHNGSQCVII